ncbi:MAG: apolipoprotein N-acyltransferase [Myxococcota bacterium]|nr:apolipoprotein N-acyltransferase [Myxococcota bacterium]
MNAVGGKGRLATRVHDLWWCLVAAVFTFAAFPTALAPDYSFWPLIWVSHIPLLWILKDKSPKQAFMWGLLCGTLINAGGYYWIASMLETFGQLPLPLALVGLALHSVQLGLIWALWAWLMNRVGNTTSMPIEWSAPIIMVAVEFMMPRIFPAYMGNSQYLFLPIMQIADLFGVTAITFLIYRVNAVLYLWLRSWLEGRSRPVKATWVTIAMMVLTCTYGLYRIYAVDAISASSTKLTVGIVEGDVGIFQEETQEKRRNHLLIQQRLSARLEAEGVDLIVWPESAYRRKILPRRAKKMGVSDRPLVDDYRQDRATPEFDRSAPIRGFRTPLLFGGTSFEKSDAPRWEGDGLMTPRNSAFLLDRDGRVLDVYDKVYLLVFGEYVPFAKYIPFIYQWIPAAGDLEAGTRIKALTADVWDKGPIRLGVLVCYEAILPAFVRRFIPERPNIFVNLTNDDWFGKTAERYLHFLLTIPRAIEHRTPVVRATLTGVSGFVDPVGRVVKETKMTGAETLSWSVPVMQSQTVYQIVGDVFPWSCVGVTLFTFGWGRVRRWRG